MDRVTAFCLSHAWGSRRPQRELTRYSVWSRVKWRGAGTVRGSRLAELPWEGGRGVRRLRRGARARDEPSGRDPRRLKQPSRRRRKAPRVAGASPSTLSPLSWRRSRLVRATNGFDCIDPLTAPLADPLSDQLPHQLTGFDVFFEEPFL